MKSLAVMVLAVLGSACGANPVDQDPDPDRVAVDLSSHDQVIKDWVIEGREPAPDLAPGAGSQRGTVTPPVGCMVVQYCDAPGPDGTRCVWTGCSLLDALEACALEAPRECPRLVCPFVFVGKGGVRFHNGACE